MVVSFINIVFAVAKVKIFAYKSFAHHVATHAWPIFGVFFAYLSAKYGLTKLELSPEVAFWQRKTMIE